MPSDREVILITGCSGRIGFKLAERFSKEYQVVGFDVFLAGHLPSVDFVVVDLASDESTAEGLRYVKQKFGNKIASVVHLAAYYSFSQQHSSNYERITVKGTERLLQGLKEFEVEQFMFSSTMLVHKPSLPGQKITEDSPIEAKWDYPLSKVHTEAAIHRLRGKIPSVILRIAGVYDDHCHSIPLSNQLQRIFENQMEAHVFAGDVTHGSSFVHMDDLVDCIALCVQKRKQLPEELVLLIGEPETMSYDQIQRLMAKLVFGKEWKTWSVPKPIAKIGAWFQQHLPFMKPSFIQPWMITLADDHYELDVSRAQKFLGWTPKHRLEETIPRWVKELKEDPTLWYDENKLKRAK
ncbi:MAG TPA: NAD(P)-dependent oxidoreductase [Rhabdochlamydiaceae bacterium]|jgi:nucleoside-diphosphate-sugar epimerase